MFVGSYRQENLTPAGLKCKKGKSYTYWSFPKDKDTHMKRLNKIDLLPGGHRSKVPHFKNT